MDPDPRFELISSVRAAGFLRSFRRKALFAAMVVSGSVAAPLSAQNQPAAPPPGAPVNHENGATVLLLGDSLSLCGFGKRLDEHLRQAPGVKAVFTYMACATQPLSWLKNKPYTSVKTRCGFWSIESVPGSNEVRELEDVYGMRRGATPKAHPVPKLEDLLTQIRPDVLIMQTGGNLFDLFPDHKTVRPERDASALSRYIAPFMTKATSAPSTLKKIYWVASPTSGRVSQAIQDFVVEQVRAHFGEEATVIDSRPLVAYPYRHMEPDHEHFFGEDMDLWADKVFTLINQDISSPSFASLKPLSEPQFPHAIAVQPTAAATATPNPPAPVAAATPADTEQIMVSARLVFKSTPMSVNEFLPYQESMVAYVYDIRRVLRGSYSERQVLVLHPAYIGLRKQSLRKYRIGRTYKLRLREVEGTPWDTVKRRDESGRIDLQPYIQLQDEAKYPGSTRAN